MHPKIPIGRKRIKITIESKNCRLKITAESKNYYLKILVRVRVCTCQNVGSGVVRCVSFPFATLVAGDFFVNVCSHCFVVLLFSIAKVSIIFIYPKKI